MHPASEQHIPDGLLAANVLLAENSRQGVPTSTHALHQGFGFVISSTSLGIKGSLYDGRIGSRCTGKERDTESGNDYFGARYYESSIGRWLSPDPYDAVRIKQGMEMGGLPKEAATSFFDGFLENPQNLNKYSYSLNNPLRFFDPTGASPVEGHHLIPVRGNFGALGNDFANQIKTGPLSGNGYPNQPGFNEAHRAYNDAVKEMLNQAESTEGPSANWSLDQWKQFATKVLNSDEPAIKNFLDELEENNAGAKAALAASIAAYRVSAQVMARAIAAGIAASIAARGAIVTDFFLCVTCNITHESVTHKIIYGPPPQD